MNVPAYDLTADPYFKADAAGHLAADFGGGQDALRVERRDDGYHCFLTHEGVIAEDGVFATYVTRDPREVLALAVALDDTSPLQGFSHEGRTVRNPFADPRTGEWRFRGGYELASPRTTYGRSYDEWLDALVARRHAKVGSAESPASHAVPTVGKGGVNAAPPRVVVVISGGVLQGAYATDPAIQVQLLDHDDLEQEEPSRTERDAIEARATVGLHALDPERITAEPGNLMPLVVASLHPTPVIYDYAFDAPDGAMKAAAANEAEREGRTWSVMTDKAFLAAERQHYLNLPLTETTVADYNAKLNCMPPIDATGRAGMDRFILWEAETGSYHVQYALLNGRAFWRMVDVNDQSTWITASEIAAYCAADADAGAGKAADEARSAAIAAHRIAATAASAEGFAAKEEKRTPGQGRGA